MADGTVRIVYTFSGLTSVPLALSMSDSNFSETLYNGSCPAKSDVLSGHRWRVALKKMLSFPSSLHTDAFDDKVCCLRIFILL